jgi:phospholipase/carboxylesterase
VHRERPAAADPAGALVLLHGRGVDENDLFPLLDELDPERRLVGACPRGPLSLPPGGFHWYAVQRIGFPDPATFHATYPVLAGWLDGFLEHHTIPHDRLIIGGFSMGAVMSYSLTLGPERPRPAGLVALSGFIPTVPDFDLDVSRAEGLPVAIGHGIHDPIIPVDFGHDARDRLTDAGAEITYRESPMPHAVDPGFLAELRPWLTRHLSL